MAGVLNYYGPADKTDEDEATIYPKNVENLTINIEVYPVVQENAT